MQFVQVTTTFASEAAARALANRLVEARLVACAQVEGPIASVYRWQGKVEHASEWRLAMKTRDELFAQIEAMIMDAHEYDVPQIVAVPIVKISAAYAKWLDEQLPARAQS